MRIVICGAGEVGSHAAEVLADGNTIVMIDKKPERLRVLEDTLDIGTLAGNCTSASVLREARADAADFVLAATDLDEVNLVAASIAKGMGARRCVARVHQVDYVEQQGLDYQQHFKIDALICPEYSAAQAMARMLRSPGAIATEAFGRGQIEMQEFAVTPRAAALGKTLLELPLPTGTRLAAIRRGDEVFLPTSTSVISPGDIVVLVGNSPVFRNARKLFVGEAERRRRVVIMGGPPMAVWLCRALHDRSFALRIFEMDRDRAESLAEQLDWVTVIQADPTDRAVFQEEQISQADVFIALQDDDEANIISCVLAKSLGVTQVFAVIQRPNYLGLLNDIGVDQAFSPRLVAVRELDSVLDTSPLRRVASLAEGVIDVYQLHVSKDAIAIGERLREIKLTPHWMIAAIQRGNMVYVPSADDVIELGDILLVIGQHGREDILTRMFAPD